MKAELSLFIKFRDIIFLYRHFDASGSQLIYGTYGNFIIATIEPYLSPLRY